MNGYVQKKAPRSSGGGPDRTGIPAEMKRRFEANSGLSFDDVRVTYNSPLPARLDALAFTRGTEVYIGPGEEGHLPHELGHVIQQKQGRVVPNTRVCGQSVNDSSALEREADQLGRTFGRSGGGAVQLRRGPAGVIQCDKGAAWNAANSTIGMRRGNRRNSIVGTGGYSRYLLGRARHWMDTILLPAFHSQFNHQVHDDSMDRFVRAEALKVLGVGNCGEFSTATFGYLAENAQQGRGNQWTYRCAMYGYISWLDDRRFDHGFTMLADQQFNVGFLPAGVDTSAITVIDGWANFKVETLEQFCNKNNPYGKSLNPRTNIRILECAQSGAGTGLTPAMQTFIRRITTQFRASVGRNVTASALARAQADTAGVFDFPRRNNYVIDIRPDKNKLLDMDRQEATEFLDARQEEDRAALFVHLPPADKTAYVQHLFANHLAGEPLCMRLLTMGETRQSLDVMEGMSMPDRTTYAGLLWKIWRGGKARLKYILQHAPWAGQLIANLPSGPRHSSPSFFKQHYDLTRELAQELIN